MEGCIQSTRGRSWATVKPGGVQPSISTFNILVCTVYADASVPILSSRVHPVIQTPNHSSQNHENATGFLSSALKRSMPRISHMRFRESAVFKQQERIGIPYVQQPGRLIIAFPIERSSATLCGLRRLWPTFLYTPQWDLQTPPRPPSHCRHRFMSAARHKYY